MQIKADMNPRFCTVFNQIVHRLQIGGIDHAHITALEDGSGIQRNSNKIESQIT